MTLSLPRTALSLAELDDLDHEGVVRFVRRLEEYGHRMVWLPEINGREAFTTAALVLASTERLVVGNGVARALERVPKSAGSAARGLAEGYPGRYVLGLGVSGAVRARGTGPLPFLREYLDGVDKVAAGVPRVLGAYSPGITRLAAERADGLITFLVPPEHTRWARETVGPDLFLSVVQWAVVGRDRAAAREVARRRLAYYLTLPHQIAKLTRLGFTDADLAPPGSDLLVDALVAGGTPEQVREALRRQYDAGATQVAVSLLGPLDDAKLDAYRALTDSEN
ncbi:putative F420-dependent oxidoreductase [Amycolatopsis bartoniae]|uniref:LLM class F420-dependent oxidoreductase n=1 Tax=Amycolatopsis bartoniae TaxID=941986 RepID=A0A8H9ITC2_9PSEU|nr:LLM class flavin-dependent oxidoreductase [Amycolatopsis bartoniae]MBB2936788.1 putative F420-dependent oxidoreductase [Amycolatopsis bartoniae]TVT09164.1 LLM class flavin-dependent oxidoreductase [Amycolatopsis bartoniae]GHF50126.1 LLM class F420-dependent oxidoreductase [Amycolatopsis bartoniae]